MLWEKSFESEKLVDTAMHHFWQYGYQKASIADISKQAGASRYGIYDMFGDKHQLYLCALKHYQATVVSEGFAPMEARGAGLDELFAFRNKTLRALEDDRIYRGCLMCIAAMSMARKDDGVADNFTRQRAALLNCLNNASDQLTAEPEALADMLLLLCKEPPFYCAPIMISIPFGEALMQRLCRLLTLKK